MSREVEGYIRTCEYQIDYWLNEQTLDAVEYYVRLRKEYREQLMLEPDELDRMVDERD